MTATASTFRRLAITLPLSLFYFGFGRPLQAVQHSGGLQIAPDLWSLPPSAVTAQHKKKKTSEETKLVVAHRGANDALPEETLAAYELAAIQGAHFLECDVVVTKEGELICRHEPLLDDTTDVVKHSSRFHDRRREYIVDGQLRRGFFSVDFTWDELAETVKATQAFEFRDQRYDGLFPIIKVRTLLELADRINKWVEQKPHSAHQYVTGGAVDADYAKIFTYFSPERLADFHLNHYRALVEQYLFGGFTGNPLTPTSTTKTFATHSVGVYLETKHPLWTRLTTGFNVSSRLLDLLKEFDYHKPAKRDLLFIESFDSSDLLWWKDHSNFRLVQLVFPMRLDKQQMRRLGEEEGDHQVHENGRETDLEPAGAGREANGVVGDRHSQTRDQREMQIPAVTDLSDRYFPPVPAAFVQDESAGTVKQVTVNLTNVASYAFGIGPHKQLLLPIDPYTQYFAGVTQLTEMAHAEGLVVHPYIQRNEFFFMPLNFTADPYVELQWLCGVLDVDGIFTDSPATTRRYFGQAEDEQVKISLERSQASLSTTTVGTVLAVGLIIAVCVMARCCLSTLSHQTFRMHKLRRSSEAPPRTA